MVGPNRFSGLACVMAARMTDASDDKRYFLISYNKADLRGLSGSARATSWQQSPAIYRLCL